MLDELTDQQEQTTETNQTEQKSTSEISKFIAPDGKLLEGWRDILLPEEIRKDKFFDLFTDIQGIVKTAGHQASTIGKYSTTKGVLPINEKSSPQEIESYRKAMGIPLDEKGYKYEIPKDISEEDMSPEGMAEIFKEFHKGNFTQQQTEIALNLFANYIKATDKIVSDEIAKQVEEVENTIRKERGDNYDSDVHLANLGIEKITAGWAADRKERFIGKKIEKEDGKIEYEGGINDPQFALIRPIILDFCSEIGSKLSEHKIISEAETTGGSFNIQKRIDDLRATPGFMDGTLRNSLDTKDREKHQQILNEIDALMHKLYPK